MGVKGYHDLDRGSPLVSRGWHNTKLALRIFSILLCSAAIGIQVPTALRYKTEANRLQIDYDAAVDIAITIAPPVSSHPITLSILCDLAPDWPSPVPSW
jgi:hypothetical protein